MPSTGTQNPDDYSGVLVTQDFAGLAERFVRVYDILIADGDPALAALLRRAFVRFQGELEDIAREVSAHARQWIKEEEANSRVRPDTGGHGGPRLQDHLGVSYPLTGVPGSVGVNFEPALYAEVPWWWTNEEGYSGHIGRVVHGFFYEQGFTGASRPDPGAFREHPLFRAEGPQRDSNAFGPDHDRQPSSKASKGVRPGMRIENPIPARQFVRKGLQRAEVEWHAKIGRAKARFDRELDRIARLVVPKPNRPAGRGRTPRRRP